MIPYTGYYVEVVHQARKFAYNHAYHMQMKTEGREDGLLMLARMRLEIALAVYKVVSREIPR